MSWPHRALQWSFCAFIAWASVRTFLDAWPSRDVHALVLAGAELIAIVAFLVDRFAAAACAVLCAVFAVAAIITTLRGEVALEFLYFAATAVTLEMSRRGRVAAARTHVAQPGGGLCEPRGR